MSALQANPFLFAGGGDAGYVIERSLRFNSADNAYLSRTPSSAGNLKTWTFSCWVKRTKIDTGNQAIFGARLHNGRRDFIGFEDDQLRIQLDRGYFAIIETNAKIRDPSAWYHFVFVWNTTVGTSSDRMQIYINNVRQAVGNDGHGYPSQNEDSTFNNNCLQYIGARNPSGSVTHHFNGYIAEVHFIDGQALSPTDFGETDDNNAWQAKEFSGTYGSNGYYLNFADNSSDSALGTDTSGNSNDFTPNNLTALVPASIATGTTSIINGSPSEGTAHNNLWNGAYSSYPGDFLTGADGRVLRIDWSPGLTNVTKIRYYSYNGNDRHNVNSGGWSSNSGSGGGWKTAYNGSAFTLTRLELQKADGASYVKIGAIEINGVVVGGSVDPDSVDCLRDSPGAGGTDTGAGGEIAGNYATLNPLNSTLVLSNGNLDSRGNNNWNGAPGTIAMFSGKWYWEVDNINDNEHIFGIVKSTQDNITWNTTYGYGSETGGKYRPGLYNQSYGSSYSTNDVIGIAFDADNGTLTFYKNGTSQGTAFTGLTDGPYLPSVVQNSSGRSSSINFGQRAFHYQNAGTNRPSADFKCLCTSNLPEPTIADPSQYFDTKLWTGTGSTNSIATNFSPDFVWIKSRSDATYNKLYDIIRGAGKDLVSNLSSGEGYRSDTLTSFDSTGFTLGSDGQAPVNRSGRSYVGWAWDAGTSTVTNTAGSTTSQVRANPTAGFSIVSYTGTQQSNTTVGHGLNAEPHFIIIKERTNGTQNWNCYHKDFGNTKAVYLNLQQNYTSSAWSNTTPTSTVFTVGAQAGSNGNNQNIIAYCFAPVEGYSAIGKWTGNGSTDGPIITTGFSPAFVLWKNPSSGNDWRIIDNKRIGYNPENYYLRPNQSGDEISYDQGVDFLAGGFKIRRSDGWINNNNNTYLYIAFAEHPFKTARAR